MNPTNELLAKLDELGVEYDAYDLPNGNHGVSWIDGNDIEWEAIQRGENFEIHALQLVTPEQAVVATVGEEHEMHICKRCGVAYELSIIDKGYGKPRFCPNCGYRRSING